MIIYFHIDEVGRDAIVASALKRAGAATGCRVIYGNRRSSELLKRLNVFDAIILPSLLHFKWYFPDSRDLPSNVFIMPTEAVGQATGHLRRIYAKYFGNNDIEDAPWHRAVGGFLLWGFDHIQSFHEFHPEYLPKCVVVGHPRLSKLCIAPKRRHSNKKTTIGFISRFGKLNCFDRRGNMSLIFDGMKDERQPQPTYENSPNMDVEDLIYTEVVDLRVQILIMKALNTNEYDFVIRPHPREDAGQWRRFVKKYRLDARLDAWDSPFSSWLGEVDYIVGPPSTSYYDILAQGGRPICTDKIVAKRSDHILTESDDNNQILDYVYRPESLNELLDTIKTNRAPPLASGFEKVLEGQAGLSIAAVSIDNILATLRAGACSKDGFPELLRKSLALAAYWVVTVSRAYAAKIRDKVNGLDEQGASFYLTLGRILWIDRLSERVTASADERR